MGDEQIIICDRFGVPKAELNQANIETAEWPLKGPGNAAFSMKPEDPKALQVLLNKVEVQFWYDDQLGWWGVPRRCGGNSKLITFQCEDLKSYFHYRFIMTASQQYAGIDLFQIGWNLVSAAQTGTLMTFNIIAGNWVASGIPASAWFKREEHKNILEALDEYADLDNNFKFEWWIKVYPDGRREWWPSRKRGVLKPKLVLEWGKNVTDYTFNEDGVEQSTYCMNVGGTDTTGQRVEQFYEDAAKSAEYGVVYQKVISDGSQLDPAFLLSGATAEVNRTSDPIVIPDLTVQGMYGLVEPGDVVPVDVRHGRVNMLGNYRITNITRPGNTKDVVLSFNKDI